MRLQSTRKVAWLLILWLVSLVAISLAGDKIPVTTGSQKARELFLQGRDIFEKLQAQESLTYFEQAVAADSNFALAYLFSAQAQPNVKGFFARLNQAVARADKVSAGERYWILGTQAGANGLPQQQREYFQKLVAAFPNDERGHTVLGNQYFAQQEWKKAIESFNKATQLNPNFSQPYNQLGYAYRFLGDYANAEKTFQKYIELIPNDPNPYDSYAELLMKMGQFEKSIEQYQKALAINPNFVASHLGIATDLNYLGKHAAARKQLQTLYEMARNDGERRAVYFAIAVSYVDEGNLEQARTEYEKGYALAEKINDAAALAGDLIIQGNILLEAGKYEPALKMFEKSVQLIQASNLSQEVKDNSKRAFLYNSARVAIMQQDLATARAKTEKFQQAVQAVNNPLQMFLYHELMGMIACAGKNYEAAIAEYNQANQQNPYILYRLALAYQGKGDTANCKTYCQRAAKFNALNNLNQAFVRTKAEKLLAQM